MDRPGAGHAVLRRRTSASEAPYAVADRIFAEYQLDAHVPGLVYGVVANGRLVHVGTLGIQDTESNRPVTADTLFRVASMTKAFTALTVLKLRDDGRLRLDAPASEYVPEMKGWDYPTDDSPPIRVRDLLNHAGGFVTDDPWGDRQTPLPEAEFSKLLQDGVPFTTVPGTRYEYSNLGYAILGRIVTNVSKAPYSETITRTLLEPLGMHASGFDAEAAPRERRALGYRWEDDAWRLEPTLGPGTFGAMGGLQTSANDYAKWVTFLLSAWPPRDGADSRTGPACDGSRTRAGLELSAHARPAGSYRYGTQPPADRLRHGHDRRDRRCARAHDQPQRRLSRLRLTRAAAAGPRHRHLRDGEPDLRGTFARGLGCRGRTRRSRTPRRGA